MSRLAPVLAAPALALALAGCDDAGRVDSLNDDVTTLRAELRKSESERERLARRLDDAEQRLQSLRDDLLAGRPDAAPGRAAAPEAGAVPTEAEWEAAAKPAGAPAADLSAEARELARVLESDDGLKALDGAMRTIERRRDEQRTIRMADAMVDAFAAKANLTTDQTDRMRKLSHRSATAMREVWSALRDQGEMTQEQRQAARTDAMAKIEEINRRTDEEASTILDASQFETYRQDVTRMRGGRGGMGGPGGDGGFPGRGGAGR